MATWQEMAPRRVNQHRVHPDQHEHTHLFHWTLPGPAACTRHTSARNATYCNTPGGLQPSIRFRTGKTPSGTLRSSIRISPIADVNNYLAMRTTLARTLLLLNACLAMTLRPPTMTRPTVRTAVSRQNHRELELAAKNAAAIMAAAMIGFSPTHGIASATELPGTLLAAGSGYQTAESALKADLTKAKKLDPEAEAKAAAKAEVAALKKAEAAAKKEADAAKAQVAAAKTEARSLKAVEAKATKETETAAKAEAAALKAAKAEAEKLAQKAAKDEAAASAASTSAAPAKVAAPAKAATLVKTAASAKAAVPAKAKGALKDLSSAAGPTDVAVAVRSDAVDLKARKLPSSIGAVLPFPIGPVKIDLAISINKVTEAEAKDSDVVVSLPTNLVKAGKLAVGGDAGVIVDIPGITSGRFELDLVTPRNGEADVVVTSKNIPKLPLQKTNGLGRFCFECGNGNEQSDWFVARNLGNGVQFYGNAKTGVSQFEVPKGF